jgi:hypothetical protein
MLFEIPTASTVSIPPDLMRLGGCPTNPLPDPVPESDPQLPEPQPEEPLPFDPDPFPDYRDVPPLTPID